MTGDGTDATSLLSASRLSIEHIVECDREFAFDIAGIKIERPSQRGEREGKKGMTGGLEFRDARGTTLACCSSERPVIQRCGLPGKGMAKWRLIRSTRVQPCTIIILSYIA